MIKLGLLPPYRLGVTADPAWMGAFARHADEVGFESLLTVEHVVVPVGYASRYPYSDTGRMPLPDDCDIPDPLDLLAWIAGRTERLRLGTGILVLPEHHPLQLAKRVATIDRLSGGRVFLGVGVGWMREELEAVGIDPATRGARTDEGIEALRAIWRDDEVTFDGVYSRFDRVRSHPKPAQASSPDPRRRPQRRRRPPGRSAGRRVLPAGSAGRGARRAPGPGRRGGPGRRPRPADVPLTMGGLLGEGTTSRPSRRRRRRGAERVVLSTRIDDLDQLRRDMDAAVAAAARVN